MISIYHLCFGLVPQEQVLCATSAGSLIHLTSAHRCPPARLFALHLHRLPFIHAHLPVTVCYHHHLNTPGRLLSLYSGPRKEEGGDRRRTWRHHIDNTGASLLIYDDGVASCLADAVGWLCHAYLQILLLQNLVFPKIVGGSVHSLL